MADQVAKKDPPPTIPWADLLSATPPNVLAFVTDHLESQASGHLTLATPDLLLHCQSEHCGDRRFFHSQNAVYCSKAETQGVLVYKCRNCESAKKYFAVIVIRGNEGSKDFAVKLGEFPPYGDPVPSKLISLVGPEREIFLRGRRCENFGLGIGAATYYRRVVESQKDRLVAEIRKVAVRLNAPASVLSQFDQAAKDTQFSRAVELLKGAIPEALFIDGHNPLTLLHAALSEHVHLHEDADFLANAASIRVILVSLAERLDSLLKQDAELKGALSRLLNRGQSPSPTSTRNT